MGCCWCRDNQVSEPKARQNYYLTAKDMVPFKDDIVSKYYTIDSNPIASGRAGETRKAVLKTTGQPRAIKTISKAKVDQEKLINEINILRNLHHPNIAQIFEIYQDRENFYIVTELCTGKDLFGQVEKQEKISEAFAASIMQQLLSAVSYIHKHNVIHLSIRPESIKFEKEGDNANIKIVNFETAETYRFDSPLTAFVGTPEYAAPEMIDGLYNVSVDIWACGVILYLLLSGKAPFTGKNKAEVFESIKNRPLNFDDKIWNEISSEAKDLIKQLLNKDLGQRIPADQALQHPWFKMKLSEKMIGQLEMQQALTQLKDFKTTKNLQVAFWTYISNFVVCKEEKDKLLNLFNALDTDKDGQISKSELKDGFKKFYKNENQSTIDNIFSGIDKNADDHIDYNEFVGTVMNKKILFSKENLEAAFKMLDTNNSGGISINELKDAFGADAFLLDDAYWTNLLKEGDKNGDGEIQLNEFVNLMLTIKI